MIVKVQISTDSSDGVKYVLIYNEDRTLEYQDVAHEKVLMAMAGSLKEFWEAEVIPHPKNWMKGESVINLIEKAKWQNW